jgi:hypothetical protein
MTRFYEKYGFDSRHMGIGWYCLESHADRLGGILVFDHGEEALRLQWQSIAERNEAERRQLFEESLKV